MAMLGITCFGYQDPIREHVRDPKITPPHIFRSGLYRDKNFRLPPIELRQPKPLLVDDPKHTTVTPEGVDGQTAYYGFGTRNSYAEYMRLREKHIRNTKEPNDIYRRPLVTSGQIGAWRKDMPLSECEPWAVTKRHAHINSEMTKFVDILKLSDRQFSLF